MLFVLHVLIKIQDGPPQDQGTLCTVLLGRPLLGRVAPAILGPGEDHGGGDEGSGHGRVVAGERDRPDAVVAARPLDAVDGLGPEFARQQVHVASHSHVQPVQRRHALDAPFHFAAHGLEQRRLAVHQAECQPHVRLDVARSPRPAADVGQRCVPVFLVRQLLQLRDDFGRPHDGVPPPVHGVRVGVSVLAFQVDRICSVAGEFGCFQGSRLDKTLTPGHALPSCHPPNGFPGLLQIRVLLAVYLEMR